MSLTIHLARGNVRRSVRDYSIFFATLAFAACLLYSFTSAGTYMSALDLTGSQLHYLDSSLMDSILSAFSSFVVLIFAIVIISANRFLVRRRKREFALYGLLGMGPGRVARILSVESLMVGAVSLVVGLVAGVLLSPVFGLVTSFVFRLPWVFSIVLSPSAALWTLGCFGAISLVSMLVNVIDVLRHPLIDLIKADHAVERPRAAGRLGVVGSLVVGALELAFVWFTATILPGIFLALFLPMALLAFSGTFLVLRSLAIVVPRALRQARPVYLRGLTCFVTRQLEGKVTSSCTAVTSVCVLLATGVCLVAGGAGFCVGAHGGYLDPDTADSLSLFAYIALFYGAVLLVTAAAILALQQVSEAADKKESYLMLSDLGCDRRMLRGAVRRQVGVYFLVPLAMALVHDFFGLQFTNLLVSTFDESDPAPVAAVLVATIVVMGAYYLLTCRECERAAFPAEAVAVA
ncbi:MAG: ABC transporter permease [Atopobiaceae bacterium]|jgi:putative ABC transport system permease protein|nr:ABC transporter permease [Atopobiaceae bacterium]MCI2173844.1 ABC transporter permease [Atopobiaceae bacterium]MCI2208066.1 ABC transporter permease [Atopobiaceae bacterium]